MVFLRLIVELVMATAIAVTFQVPFAVMRQQAARASITAYLVPSPIDILLGVPIVVIGHFAYWLWQHH